jgi:hypothetical protein
MRTRFQTGHGKAPIPQGSGQNRSFSGPVGTKPAGGAVQPVFTVFCIVHAGGTTYCTTTVQSSPVQSVVLGSLVGSHRFKLLRPPSKAPTDKTRGQGARATAEMNNPKLYVPASLRSSWQNRGTCKRQNLPLSVLTDKTTLEVSVSFEFAAVVLLSLG